MDATEYYSLPYGVGDRLELQNFFIAELNEVNGKRESQNVDTTNDQPTMRDMINFIALGGR